MKNIINKQLRPPQNGSYSNDFMQERLGTPQLTPLIANTVSHYRKSALAEDISHGIYRNGTGPQYNETGLTRNSNVSSLIGFNKSASVLSGNYGGYHGASGSDTTKMMPEVYSPLWLTSNLNLPRDRATINAWCRAFFALNPFVQNAIQLHSTYPISKLNIKCPDKKIEQFFNDMIEEIDLMNICVQVAQEYWLLGEAFINCDYDENTGKWSRVFLQNPDYMVVQPNVAANESIIMIKPDENLKNIVKGNSPSNIEQRKQLPQYVVDAVKRGENILLDNFRVTHLARKISPYDIRGTGLPVSIFRQLCLFDRLRESKYAQADNMINPMTLVKIGGNGPDALHPSHADLEAWRQTFEAASSDKNFAVFTHPDVTVERVGYGQGIYDISGDITQLMKEIFIGLQTPQVAMDGGSDTTYANGGVALDVLRQRYMQFRYLMASFLKRKIFAPISHVQEFYETKNGKKQLIIPDIDWNHMAVFDTTDYVNTLKELSDAQEGKTARVSLSTLYRSLGLEEEEEIRKLRKQAIQAEISKKEAEALSAMSLTELRSLDEDEDIPEPIHPEEVKEEPVPGEMPGGDLGSLPGLGGDVPPPVPEPTK